MTKQHMSIRELSARVQGLQAAGVDCTQWAASHGYALGTKTNHREAELLREKQRDVDEYNRKVELARQGFSHARDAFNTGKSNMGNDYNYSTITASSYAEQSWVSNPPSSSSQLYVGVTPATAYGSTWFANPPAMSGALFNTFPQAEPVVITGKQYVVVCNGRVEYCDTKEVAQTAAERLAHANQSDAFILTPTSKVSPKRDVITTSIKLGAK